MVMPGGVELLIIAGVVVMLFGAKKLPALGGAIGESIKNFKSGVKDGDKKLVEGESDEESDEDKDKKAEG